MCAILGSPRATMFEILLTANAERGTFSTGISIISKGESGVDVDTTKFPGALDLDRFPFSTDEMFDEEDYYIGHLQAPTSSEREWREKTSHPFSTTSYTSFHNGVLTNSEKLKDKYTLQDCNLVDSSVIPQLIKRFASTMWNLHDVLADVCGHLEGTFGLCVVDNDDGSIYLARQGSALFINQSTGDFSSIKGSDGWVSVPEGKILQYKPAEERHKWHQVADFKTDSPYLFL